MVGTALCCALSGLGWGSPALAQQCATAGAQAQAKSDVAKDLYEQGWAALQKKNWEAARAAFLEAWRCKQHWQIALSLGWAEVKTGKYLEGAGHLRYFQRESQGDQAATAADRKTAQ